MYTIHLLPAGFGDSILIEYGEEKSPNYILIDGGPYYEFDEVMKGIKAIVPDLKQLELLVVTHIDIDHIDGIVKLLNQSPLPVEIKEIWFNGWKQLPPDDILGAVQGEYLSTLIDSKHIPHNLTFGGKAVMSGDQMVTKELEGGMLITLLSPDKYALNRLRKEWDKTLTKAGITQGDTPAILKRLEDDHRYKDEDDDDLLGELDIEALANASPREDSSPANGSSIAFIAEYDKKRCFFAGDAHSDKIKTALENFDLLDATGKLSVHAWKLAHHGSRKSTMDYLMELINCKHLLISSDGKRYRHPDPETLAKLISIRERGIKFYFNYHSAYSDLWDDEDLRTKYGYKTCFPSAGKKGVSIDLNTL